ncbi:MAG: M20/M25/M40 family metallo-hydrolase, partial [Ignavibacteriaceae bacterium]|nr:M20/M25/M40 family metallo-hydrolase [Ignavibacteriaceae bacterium]
MIKKIFAFILLTVTLSAQNSLIHHELNVVIKPDISFLEVTDEILIDKILVKDGLQFKLNSALTVEPSEMITKLDYQADAEDIGMDIDNAGTKSDLKLNIYKIKPSPNASGDMKLILKYNGKIESPIKQSKENYARGFSESPGIIWEEGVYLAGSTYWVPYFGEELISFNLTTTAPDNWKTVSVGSRTSDEIKNGLHIDRWESPTPQEEIFLIAAQFHEYNYPMGNVTAYAFLRTPDEALANKYLEATAQYMEMYRKLVGPFPYTKFALVENFWETGYGMPSFTLLGEKIIRLPFILHSSYPHELLHNYWGNSVYVDFKSGNWCEGLTAYMADHLIKEQRGQAVEYRSETLQKFTDYVTPENDFPLSKFSSRFDPPSEAIGYGKTSMMFHMLRRKTGDEQFIKSFQVFNRNNKFKRASFDDIRKAFEEVTGKDWKWFFDQWVNRTGAPQLVLEDVQVNSVRGSENISFTLKHIQAEDVFYLDVPVVIVTKNGTKTEIIEMNDKVSKYNITVDSEPLKILIDPEFDLMRKLDPHESAPTFTKAFGSKKSLILMPDQKDENYQQYKDFVELWTSRDETKFTVKSQNEINQLPDNESVMILGMNNKFSSVIDNELKKYNSEILNHGIKFGKREISSDDNSFYISVSNPENIKEVITLLTIGNKSAVEGLNDKLPHYAKYSYLAFNGSEPTNIEKGVWSVISSPLFKNISSADSDAEVKLETRKALAYLEPVFSAEKMMETVKFLASDDLKGRGIGTPELDIAADYIAKKFEEYGLLPGGDDATYFQSWKQDVRDKKNLSLKNIIGIIPGTNPDLSEAIVISAHYDHLGLGWPDIKKGNEGKIHNGADDNASGVSVLLELARSLGKSLKPARTIIFVAFTAEEAGLIGSRYFAANYKKYPVDKIFAILNLDTVGRLFGNKLMVLNTNTAREWKFIFMGANFTTGIQTELVTQDLDASDQTAFIEKGIPGVQLFYTGIKSDYHSPEDDADKIDADGLVKTATIAREVLEYLADRTEPMPFTGSQSESNSTTKKNTGERNASTGAMPDFA